MALGGWASLDQHWGLSEPWLLQEAALVPGHFLGPEGGAWTDRSYGGRKKRGRWWEQSLECWLRKPVLPVWEPPRAGARLQGASGEVS